MCGFFEQGPFRSRKSHLFLYSQKFAKTIAKYLEFMRYKFVWACLYVMHVPKLQLGLTMATPATPRAKFPASPTTPAAARISSAHLVQSSPHYATTRRHSLYGAEDRVIIDPGSRIWKVGFSGEGRPRDVFYPGGTSGASLWKLKRAVAREDDKLLELNLQDCLRSVFHE